MFHPIGGIERAWSMAFEHGVRDVKLGDLLGRRSPALQAAIPSEYSDRFSRSHTWPRKNTRSAPTTTAAIATMYSARASHGRRYRGPP
jgi:hypothetical protein